MSDSRKIPVSNTDMILAILFGGIVIFAHDLPQKLLIVGLAALQLAEGRVRLLGTAAGRAISAVLQLALAVELLRETERVASPYAPVLLFPLVSIASYFGIGATVAVSIAAVGAYLSLLLLEDWKLVAIDVEGKHTLYIRCLLMAGTAVLVNGLGAAIRKESARYKATAEKLEVANENLIEAQAAVQRAERLAALGQLTAGLAHELRNPLASIKGSADLLARRDPMSKELGEIISSEVDRTNLLVTRFLDFARPLEPQLEQASLPEVIDRAAARAGVAIVRDFDPTVDAMRIDPALMEQVFINLLSNAAQASDSSAPIEVSIRWRDADAIIEVRDQGLGIPREKLETIFNPFVTTKKTGVGLGLAIVAKIVDGHGGRMEVESEPGQGSTFRVILPAGDAARA